MTNTADALHQLGELYRNANGHEVWRIRDRQGRIVADDIDSDRDAAWIAADLYPVEVPDRMAPPRGRRAMVQH